MTAVAATQTKRAPRKDVFKYGIENMVLDTDFNYNRVELGDIEALAESIRVNGITQPLIGYKHPTDHEKVVIVHGYRRFHAMKLASEKGFIDGVEETAMFYLKDSRKYSTKQKHIDIAIANDGKEMTGLEKGILFSNLEKEGMSRKEISSALTVTQAHISDMIMLSFSPSPIQNAIMDGMLSSTLALKIVKENSTPEKQLEVFETAKSDMEVTTTSNPDSTKKRDKKITAKNVEGISKTPLKTLEAVIEATSNISPEDMVTISKVYSLLKKKVSVEEFIEAFTKR